MLIRLIMSSNYLLLTYIWNCRCIGMLPYNDILSLVTPSETGVGFCMIRWCIRHDVSLHVLGKHRWRPRAAGQRAHCCLWWPWEWRECSWCQVEGHWKGCWSPLHDQDVSFPKWLVKEQAKKRKKRCLLIKGVRQTGIKTDKQTWHGGIV